MKRYRLFKYSGCWYALCPYCSWDRCDARRSVAWSLLEFHATGHRQEGAAA